MGVTDEEVRPAFGRDEPDTARYATVPRSHQAVLRVVGVGGAGVNAVNRMVEAQVPGVEFVAINTDLQSLQTSGADITLHIGADLTRGLGSGSDPRVGYRAAFDEQDKIKQLLKGSDMVFLAAGAGGGTGTGAAPVVAKLARDVGALTVAAVTKPFHFEGARRAAQAEEGIAALGAEVDTLIVVPNERLLQILERRTSITDAFRVADDVLRQAVQGISDLVMLPGLINLDFADVRTTMLEAGDAILGIGMGVGEHRAQLAAEKAVASPLLDTHVEGAHSLLLSITGGPDLSLIEASEAAEIVREAAHPEANIIFGASVDEDMAEEVWITVIATRFDSSFAHRNRRRDRRDGPREPRGGAATTTGTAAATATGIPPATGAMMVGAAGAPPSAMPASRAPTTSTATAIAAAARTASRRSPGAAPAYAAASCSTCPSSSPVTRPGLSAPPRRLGCAHECEGSRRGRPSGHRRGRRGDPARGRARRSTPRSLGPHLLRHREPADRLRRRRVHADPRSRARGAERDVLVDFFVAAGGSDGIERGSELVPIPVDFGGTVQVFSVGAASCGVPGTPAGLELIAERFGTVPLADLVAEGVRLAREGVAMTRGQAYFHEILHPILTSTPEAAALYAPEGRSLAEGEVFRFPELADALERFAAEGAEPFYTGEVGRAVAEWVRERGGTLGVDDLAAYEPIEREPVAVRFRGADVLTNPPPVLGRDPDRLRARGPRAARRPHRGRGARRGDARPPTSGAPTSSPRASTTRPSSRGSSTSERLGSTTHLAALDADGVCASVTCSNGTGSGLIVPGTGVHVNNMLGEEDLNPGGFHRIPPGRRVSSMMAPTVALRDGEVVLGLGSAGSNRIRSAILETAVRVLEQGMDAAEAVRSPRLHFEAGAVQAEPGVDEEGLKRVEERGIPVVRWTQQNLYFGGVQAVTRDPKTGELSGGGDPRRGGAVVVA